LAPLIEIAVDGRYLRRTPAPAMIRINLTANIAPAK
jgi:hypothetical protein